MRRSGIITLTTDFGLSDPYVAMMKGVILTIHPGARIVDIAHQIKTGAIPQAARILLKAHRFFPEGTIHVAVVDPGVGSRRRPIALKAGEHLFVGPDNGLFGPVIQAAEASQVFEITQERLFPRSVTHTFHGRDVFAPVAAHLCLGLNLEEVGSPISDPTPLELPGSYQEDGILLGQIIEVDHFGNLITNITAQEMQGFIKSGWPEIRVGRLLIRGLGRVYADVEEGQPLALLNSSNLLEIAVNLGRASDCVGIAADRIIGAAVRVERAEQ